LSQVLPLKGNQQRMEYDPRGLGRGDFVAEIIKEAERNIRRHIRVSDRKTFIDNSIQKICRKERVAEQELRMGGWARKLSKVRIKIAQYSSDQFGVSRAEIARHLGVCTSAIAKTIEHVRAERNKC